MDSVDKKYGRIFFPIAYGLSIENEKRQKGSDKSYQRYQTTIRIAKQINRNLKSKFRSHIILNRYVDIINDEDLECFLMVMLEELLDEHFDITMISHAFEQHHCTLDDIKAFFKQYRTQDIEFIITKI